MLGSAMTREDLEATLGFKTVNYGRYVQCFTHKSAARAGTDSYERLEFIGDAVIGLVVSKYIYDRFPHQPEGFLTRLRTRLVSGKCLASFALKLRLDRFVVMNDRALRAGWNSNPRILEDVLEALVGCIYMDLGLLTAKTFLLSLLERYIDWDDIMRDTNYKDILMRYAQARGLPLPDYKIAGEPQGGGGLFNIVVVVDGVLGSGVASTKKAAEQNAAQQVLVSLNVTLD